MKTARHFWSYLAQFFSRMRNVSGICRRENQNTHFVFNKSPPHLRKSCRVWDNVEKCTERGRPQMIWRMRVAYWIPKATKILTVFPLQQWLQERASITLYVHCLSSCMCLWHLLRYLGLDKSSLICIPLAIKDVRVRWARHIVHIEQERCMHGFGGVGWRRPLRRPRLFCMGVKLGRWHCGRKGSWWCLRTLCWGEYLDLGGTR